MRSSTKHVVTFMVLVLALALGSQQVLAQPCFIEKPNTATLGPRYDMPNVATPGSILFFPFWSGVPGSVTLITVTNTNCSYIPCFDPSNFAWGDVLLHYVYIDGVTWRVTDQFEFLTPNDTLSVLAGEHAFSDGFGWLYVVALDPLSFQPIDFDWLIGDAIVGGGDDNFLWQCQAIPFQSFGDEGPGARPACHYGYGVSPTGHLLADNDGDGLADFDAAADFGAFPSPPKPGPQSWPEYNCFPNELYISHFNEQGNRIEGDLVLVTTLPVVPDEGKAVQLDFLFYNNDEFALSAQWEFDCFLAIALQDITTFVDNMPPNENESGPWDRWDTGWVRIRPTVFGEFPQVGAPVLGAFFQLVIGTDFAAGSLLHMENIVTPDYSRVPTCTEYRRDGSIPF